MTLLTARGGLQPRSALLIATLLFAPALVTFPAAAQTLSLAPAVDWSKADAATRVRLSRLDIEIAQTTNVAKDARGRILLLYRRIARAALAWVERTGPDASDAWLYAIRFQDAAEALAERAAAQPAAAVEAERAADVALEELAAWSTPAPPAERTARLARVLRDLAAPFIRDENGVGAFTRAAWLAAPAPWPSLTDLPPEAQAAAQQLADSAAQARAWPAYAPAADQLARALGVIQSARAESIALSAPAAQRLDDELIQSLTALLDPATAAAGRERLTRLAAIARLLRTVSTLDDDAAARSLRRELAAWIVRLSPDPAAVTGRGETQPARALAAWLRELASLAELSADQGMLRQLRPALRTLADSAAESREHLLRALAPALSEPDGLRSPSVLAAVAAHRRRTTDLVLLRRASAALAVAPDPATGSTPAPPSPAPPSSPQPSPPSSPSGANSAAPASIPARVPQPRRAASTEPTLRDDARVPADRLLEVARAVATPRTRDTALPALRDLAARIAAGADLPREAQFRAAAAGQVVTGGWLAANRTAAGAILAAAESARAAQRAAIQKRDPTIGAVHADHLLLLARLARLTAAADELHTLASGDPAASLQVWPGLWLAPDWPALAANQLDAALADLVALLTGPKWDEFAVALAATETRFAFPRVVARLCADHRAVVAARGLTLPASAPIDLALAAAGMPDPDAAWHADDLPALAWLSRYTAALPSLPPAEARAVADSLRDRAQALLDSWDRAADLAP